MGGECKGVQEEGVCPGGRSAGFGVGVSGLSILTEAKQNGTVHRSGSPLWGKKKNYFDRFFNESKY